MSGSTPDGPTELTPEEFQRRVQLGYQYCKELSARAKQQFYPAIVDNEETLNCLEAFIQYTLLNSYRSNSKVVVNLGLNFLMSAVESAFALGYIEALERKRFDDTLPDFIKGL